MERQWSLVAVLLLAVEARAYLWTFGEDQPNFRVFYQMSGHIKPFTFNTRQIIPIPPCMLMQYVWVKVSNNFGYTPTVKLHKSLNVVSITYGLLQHTGSEYSIVAKGFRIPDCNLGVHQSENGLPYLPFGLKGSKAHHKNNLQPEEQDYNEVPGAINWKSSATGDYLNDKNHAYDSDLYNIYDSIKKSDEDNMSNELKEVGSGEKRNYIIFVITGNKTNQQATGDNGGSSSVKEDDGDDRSLDYGNGKDSKGSKYIGVGEYSGGKSHAKSSGYDRGRENAKSVYMGSNSNRHSKKETHSDGSHFKGDDKNSMISGYGGSSRNIKHKVDFEHEKVYGDSNNDENDQGNSYDEGSASNRYTKNKNSIGYVKGTGYGGSSNGENYQGNSYDEGSASNRYTKNKNSIGYVKGTGYGGSSNGENYQGDSYDEGSASNRYTKNKNSIGYVKGTGYGGSSNGENYQGDSYDEGSASKRYTKNKNSIGYVKGTGYGGSSNVENYQGNSYDEGSASNRYTKNKNSIGYVKGTGYGGSSNGENDQGDSYDEGSASNRYTKNKNSIGYVKGNGYEGSSNDENYQGDSYDEGSASNRYTKNKNSAGYVKGTGYGGSSNDDNYQRDSYYESRSSNKYAKNKNSVANIKGHGDRGSNNEENYQGGLYDGDVRNVGTNRHANNKEYEESRGLDDKFLDGFYIGNKNQLNGRGKDMLCSDYLRSYNDRENKNLAIDRKVIDYCIFN